VATPSPRAKPVSAKPDPSRYVQYGCGWSAPAEWTNFDASLTLRWERIPLLGLFTKNSKRFPSNVRPGDIVKGLPVPNESCDGVYASHVLEHLTLEDFHTAIRNTYRILRPGGIFRLIVPDLERSAREYVARLNSNDPGPSPSSLFLRDTILGAERRQRGLWGLAMKMLNTSAHLWMWDEVSLAQALQQNGFTQIRRCDFADSDDPVFSIVEDRGRFENALAMEARR
jgi:SAM-dependent methyltransferase